MCDAVGRLSEKTDDLSIRSAWCDIDRCGRGCEPCRISAALALELRNHNYYYTDEVPAYLLKIPGSCERVYILKSLDR